MNDLKYAFRQLLKNPGFAAVALLTFALCIGANLALFTMLDDQFLRPRPVLRPNELWSIVPADASGEPRFFNFSRPYYDAIRQSNRVFKGLISINGLAEKLRASDGWEEIFGHMVTANYFDFLVTYCTVELFFSSPPLNVFGRLQDGISPAAAAESPAPIVQDVTKSLHAIKYSSL